MGKSQKKIENVDKNCTNSYKCTVWMLLHNQTNQTNSANLAICAAFLVVKIISSDHFLLLTIISSHSMSIKSKKLEFFPKFQKFAL